MNSFRAWFLINFFSTLVATGVYAELPSRIVEFPILGEARATSDEQLNGSACEKATPALVPDLSPDWLSQASAPGAKPELVVGFYNRTQGLLAGYQASNGAKILFHSVWLPTGNVLASATHMNSQTGKAQTFYGPRRERDPSTGNVLAHVQFAGVDVMHYLRESRGRGFAKTQGDAIDAFLESDSGAAFLEGVPALYAVLETLEGDDADLAVLQAPFGVLTTGLQIATGKLTGFPQADAVLGDARTKELRENCGGRASCAASGKRFLIHRNGLFDPVSKSKKAGRQKASPSQCAAGASAISRPPPASFQKNGDGNCDLPAGDCFGRCGRGCQGQSWAGNFYTDECYAHDLCVCSWNDATCIVFTGDPPCDGCGDLFSAVISWLGEVVYAICDWIRGLGEPSQEEKDLINFP